MAAFPAMSPMIDEIVGSFGCSVFGVVVMSGGAATVDLSSKMTRIDGVVTGNSTASTTNSVTVSGTTLTFAAGASDVISYIAFGLVKR